MKYPNVFQHTGEKSSLDEKANHSTHYSSTYEEDPTHKQNEIEPLNYFKNKQP